MKPNQPTLDPEIEKRFDEQFDFIGHKTKYVQVKSLLVVDAIKSFLATELAHQRQAVLEEVREKIWSFAKEECDSFDLVGIHRCSAGHCGRCDKCDVLSSVLTLLD